MSCCPKCGFDLGSNLGVSLQGNLSSITGESDPNPISPGNPNRARVRGKARDYSPAFETAWRAYGRKEEKLRAYGEWIVQARLAGGETLLLPLILSSLKWQSEGWATEGWKFAPYFERYLKRRKWEDERPPMPTGISRPHVESFGERDARMKREARERERAESERQRAATDAKVAEYRKAQREMG